MKARCGNPFQLLGGMVYGMPLPKSLAVKQAVAPIHNDVFADQEDDPLRDKRKRGERPVAVLIEGDQTLTGRDVENQRRRGDEKSDAQKASDHRNEEPVAKISHQIAFSP